MTGAPGAGSLTIALISDVFFGDERDARLRGRLSEAKAAGAQLAVLPELPLDPWFPVRKERRAEDAEPPGGPRSRMLSGAAAATGIAVVGGAVVQDASAPGKRHNTALVFDELGRLLGEYSKCHLPEEPGFWETKHYEPGEHAAGVFDQFGVPFGIQICSDANRPAGTQALAASGAELVLVPRATELETYAAWRLVFQANALTSCVFVASVNRPRPESDAPIGGPSVVVGPSGDVLLETTDPVATFVVERGAVQTAKRDYPGSLAVRADLYAEAWSAAGAEANALKRPNR